ncbi:MAG: class I SAM-dependent methyltransferase [Candidatus Micrarchaeota archaeon]
MRSGAVKDAYFNSSERIEAYETWEPINVRYNLDLLSTCGISAARTVGRSVLDVGCGFGLLLKSFSDAGARCFGIDISEVAIDQCRKRFPEIRAEVADCAHMPFPERFALITCFGTLGLVQKERHAEFLRMAHRSLEDGGILFANAPNAERPGFMDALSGKGRSSSYDNARRVSEWEGLLSEAGFRDTSVYPVLRVLKSEGIFHKNVFLRPGFGDPIVIFAKR